MSPIYEMEMRQKYQLEGYMRHWKHITMDSQKALSILLKAFMEIENSGPIYRGDNLDTIFSLIPSKRKKFHATRHRLAKSALNGRIDASEIVKSFAGIFL